MRETLALNGLKEFVHCFLKRPRFGHVIGMQNLNFFKVGSVKGLRFLK